MIPHIPYPNEGVYVIGANGTGKSSLLAHLMLDHIGRGEGFVLIDPKRDLADLIHSRVPEAALLDVRSANFGINLFACKDVDDPVEVALTLDQVMQAFEKLWNADMDATPMVSDYLSNSAMVMILTRSTLPDLERFLDDEEGTFRHRLLERLPKRYAHIARFWRQHEAQRQQDRLFAVNTVGRRVRRFLTNPLARRIFGQAESTIDWAEAMAQGRIVLARLDPQMEDLSTLVGASILLSVMNAAYGRVKPTTDFGIYCDEYHRFGTPATADLMTQGRSFRVNTFVAHQDRSQLDQRMKGATLQAGNVFVFRVGPVDAGELAGLFAVEEEELRVTGRIAVQSYDRQAVQTLMSRGHTNDLVQAISRGLTRLYDGRPPRDHNYERSDIAFTEINNYLFRAMEGNIPRRSDAEGEALISLVEIMHATKVFHQSMGFGEIWHLRRFTEEDRSGLRMWFASMQRSNDPDKWDSSALVRQWKHTSTSLRQTTHWFLTLGDLAAFLRQEPIMVDTHRYEEIRERPRSVADRVGETANMIANLPRGRALMKLRTDNGFQQEEIALPASPAAGPRRWISVAPDWAEADEAFVFHDDGPPPGVRPLT